MRSKILVWFKISTTDCSSVARGRHSHLTVEKLDNTSTAWSKSAWPERRWVSPAHGRRSWKGHSFPDGLFWLGIHKPAPYHQENIRETLKEHPIFKNTGAIVFKRIKVIKKKEKQRTAVEMLLIAGGWVDTVTEQWALDCIPYWEESNAAKDVTGPVNKTALWTVDQITA